MSSSGKPAQRILYVEGNRDGMIGGSYYSLLFLVSGLDRTRFDPLVVFARENDLLPRFRERNVRTIVVTPPAPVQWPGPLGRFFSRIVNLLNAIVRDPIRLAMLLRRERVALVHLNNSVRRNHAWMIASLIARIPCITHERGINDEFRWLDRVLARRLRAVICISKAVSDNFVQRGLGGLPVVTILNGLDPAEIRVTKNASEVRAEVGVPPTARLIGIVGGIKPWKGQETVIRAVDRIREEFPNVVCLLIGDASERDADYRREMEALIDRSGLNNRVVITGFRHDVADLVNALEVQIHASILPEPFGRVLLEGMALSKPLVASNAGGVPEIVIDGTTGLLFAPGDVDGLAGCLRRLLADPALGCVLGRAGRQRLETKFSITHNLLQTQALYSTLMAQ